MADIDIDDFANQSLAVALRFGINAHYIAAVAMLRSKLKDDVVNGQVGPFLWTQPEWDANPDRTNPALGGPFASGTINDWRAQTTVFALMAQRDYAALQATLGQNPSTIQLYRKQWPTAADPPLSADLQKACDATRDAIVGAINDQMPDPANAAQPIADASQPVASQSQVGGGGSVGNGSGGQKPGSMAPQPGGGTVSVPPSDGGTTPFAAKVDDIATQQWQFFGGQAYDVNGHAIAYGHKEGENGWYQRVGTYWLDGTNTNGVDGRNHDLPWSAAFISWVMKTSGAGSRFRYSTQHSVYVYQAIRDLLQNNSAAGFWCWRLNEAKPKAGDVVCWSRQPGIDYDHQNGGDYKGHCDIVVEIDSDRIYVIGGNVGDSVTRRPLLLAATGYLKPITLGGETLFGLMENRI